MSKSGPQLGRLMQYVCQDGYELLHTGVGGFPEGLKAKTDRFVAGYPYEEPSLLHDFANVTDPEDLPAFCDRYGLLTTDPDGVENVPHLYREAQFFRGVLSAWVSLKPGKEPVLAEVLNNIQVSEDGIVSVTFTDGSGMAWPASGIIGPSPIVENHGYSQKFTEDQLHQFIATVITQKMSQHGGISITAEPYKTTDQSRANIRTFIRPACLLVALWHMLSELVGTEESFGQCGQCGRWFRASGKNAHLKVYCSGACRVRHHRTLKAPRL
ncbi:hypothetical protein [Deinococcus marmoris]|uniref:hypothetical protein n=1 Tax=Deinococcus marmoris TaxID=249408 RepID=UPI00096A566E|nr:hypothetical protein [Deinococcus marmoris]